MAEVLSSAGVELILAPDGTDIQLSGVSILDLDDEGTLRNGDIVLLIGARGQMVLSAVRAASRIGALAVCVKLSYAELGPDLHNALVREATLSQVALFVAPTHVKWESVQALASSVFAEREEQAFLPSSESDLYELAEATAGMLSASVLIEDLSGKVLAYSGSAGGSEQLWSSSILARCASEPWSQIAKQKYVFQQLRSGGSTVSLEVPPQFGSTPVIGAGITVGERLLGMIWVQRAEPATFSQEHERMLVGAARAAVKHLVQYTAGPPEERYSDSLLAGFLAGRVPSDVVCQTIDVSGFDSAVVLGLAFVQSGNVRAEGPSQALRDRSAEHTMVVWIKAGHPEALLTRLAGKVYVLLPYASEKDAEQLLAAATRIADSMYQQSRIVVHAVIGEVAKSIDDIPASRHGVEHALDAIAQEAAPLVLKLADMRSRVLVAEVTQWLARQPGLFDPRIEALVEHDRRSGSQLTQTLQTYLDEGQDIRVAAEKLHLHPNSLRYRLRKVEEIIPMDLSDADERVALVLQLRSLRGLLL